jgi:hypothetical protein
MRTIKATIIVAIASLLVSIDTRRGKLSVCRSTAGRRQQRPMRTLT